MFLHSLTSLISNCLSLLFETQGRPRTLKPFSKNKKWGTWRDFLYLHGPHRVLLGFNPPFSLLLLSPEGSKGRTRKGIKFYIERFIIHLAEELGFGENTFQYHLADDGLPFLTDPSFCLYGPVPHLTLPYWLDEISWVPTRTTEFYNEKKNLKRKTPSKEQLEKIRDLLNNSQRFLTITEWMTLNDLTKLKGFCGKEECYCSTCNISFQMQTYLMPEYLLLVLRKRWMASDLGRASPHHPGSLVTVRATKSIISHLGSCCGLAFQRLPLEISLNTKCWKVSNPWISISKIKDNRTLKPLHQRAGCHQAKSSEPLLSLCFLSPSPLFSLSLFPSCLSLLSQSSLSRLYLSVPSPAFFPSPLQLWSMLSVSLPLVLVI